MLNIEPHSRERERERLAQKTLNIKMTCDYANRHIIHMHSEGTEKTLYYQMFISTMAFAS